MTLTRFHINKKGVPSKCVAKHGSCPLGNQNQHFKTEKEAQNYVNNLSEKQFGMLPEIKENNLSDEWKNKFLEYKNFNEFVKENARDIMSDKIFEGSKDLQKSSLEKWKELHYENSSQDFKELKIEESVTIVKNNINSSELHGWFREYNSEYKPSIENSIITNPEVRNASLNIAYLAYKDKTNENLSYHEFVNKEIEIYRGGNFNMIKEDVFVSYSFDKKIAKKFASETTNSRVESLRIKMKDTLGSLQTTGEAEVMIPRKYTKY